MTVLPTRIRPAPLRAARKADSDYGASGTPDWRTIEWRDHVHAIDVAQRRVAYVELGDPDAPTVLFIHGLGGCWQNWLENMPAAAQEHHVVSLDLPGFGRSEMPVEPISISGYAKVVDEFCARLGLDAVAVVGNSMGGFTGAELALAFPQRVERLALVAAAGISITNMRRFPTMTIARALAAGRAQNRIDAARRGVPLRPRIKHMAFATVFRHPTLIRSDLLWEVAQGTGKRGFLPALEALLTYDFRHRLPEIGCPTLIVQGTDDMLVPVHDADEFERLIDDTRKVVLRDTGHTPMLERPRTFNKLLLEFIDEPVATSHERSGETVEA